MVPSSVVLQHGTMLYRWVTSVCAGGHLRWVCQTISSESTGENSWRSLWLEEWIRTTGRDNYLNIIIHNFRVRRRDMSPPACEKCFLLWRPVQVSWLMMRLVKPISIIELGSWIDFKSRHYCKDLGIIVLWLFVGIM